MLNIRGMSIVKNFLMGVNSFGGGLTFEFTALRSFMCKVRWNDGLGGLVGISSGHDHNMQFLLRSFQGG